MVFILGRFSLAYIKSLSYGIDLAALLTTDLFIAPYLLFLLLIYTFAVSLVIVLYKLHRNGFLAAWFTYQCQSPLLVGLSFFLTALFSVLLYLFPGDILKRLDRYTSLELKRMKYIQHAAFLEPRSFHHYKNWVIYIPDIQSNTPGSRHFARIYKRKNNHIQFAGQGYIRQLANKTIQLQNVTGYSFTSFTKGSVKRYTLAHSNIFQPSLIKEKNLKKALASWKIASASPELPFTNRGQRSGYRYFGQLELIKGIQSFILRLSPLLMLSYTLLLLHCLRQSYQEKRELWFFPLLFLWFLILLAVPISVKVEYGRTVSFYYLYLIPVSGAILLLLARYYHFLFLFIRKVSLLYSRSMQNLRRSFVFILDNFFVRFFNTKFMTHSFRENRFTSISNTAFTNVFAMAKVRTYALLLISLAKMYTIVWLGFFCLTLLWRLFLHWQLNQGIDQFFWYLLSQCLDIPELLFSQTPFLTVVLLSISLYFFGKGNLLSGFLLIGRNPRFLLAVIIGFSFCFCALSFILREQYAYSWKSKGQELYKKYVLYDNRPKRASEYLSNNRFIRLPSNAILFYGYAKKKYRRYLLSRVLLDDFQTGNLYTANEAEIINSKLIINEAYLYKTTIDHKIKIESVNQKSWQIPKNTIQFLSSSASPGTLWDMDTKSLFLALNGASDVSSNSVNYMRALFWLRLLPFLLFSLLCLAYLLVDKLTFIASLPITFAHVVAGFSFLIGSLYMALYLIIMF